MSRPDSEIIKELVAKCEFELAAEIKDRLEKLRFEITKLRKIR